MLRVGSLPSHAVPYPTIIFTGSVDGDWDRNESAGQCVVFLEPERPSLVKDSAHQRPSLVKDSAGSESVHPQSKIVLRVGSLPSRAVPYPTNRWLLSAKGMCFNPFFTQSLVSQHFPIVSQHCDMTPSFCYQIPWI